MTDSVAASEPERFEPDWRSYHRRLIRRGLWFVPLAVMMVLIVAWPQVGLAFVTLGLGLLLGGIALSLYFGRMRVAVEGDVVVMRGPLRTQRWSRHDIGTLVFVPLPPLGRPSLYAVAPTLERMFSLSGEYWDEETLDAVASAIGAPVVRAPAGVAPKELAERYPGTVGWTTTRPWLYALLLAGVFVAVLLVAIVASAVVMVATGQVSLPGAG